MKTKACKKLHIQFGHPHTDRLHGLLKDAKVLDKEVFDFVADVEKACDTCNRPKKPKLRPVVEFALARDFNNLLAMDFKPYNNAHFLHMTDHATRFSSAWVIPNKRHDVVIETVFKHWTALFGAPKKILSNNGSELDNQVLHELGELLNIEVKTTGAESLWSNGITEQHNGIIGNMVDKILHDQNCYVELALAWAVSAENSLSNVFGYSPSQLVFGKNPNLPSVLTDEPPALENVTSSQVVADHLYAISAARKSFVEAESSDKLKRALARKIIPATSLIYEIGDKVYYKRQPGKWRDPGSVIGKEKHQFFC